jgi:hypothetical protein
MLGREDNYFERFLCIIDSLESEKVDYVLIGGFAVVLYGMPRLTQDVDLFVNPHSENINRLVSALYKVFQDDSLYEITLEELLKYPVIRYGSEEGFYIDILIKIGEAFSFKDLKSQVIEIEGHKVRTATPEILYRLKKDTVRPVDRSDASFLKEWILRNPDKKKRDDP